jgi:DNA-binding Lrp family transcriptional regulator
MTDWWTDIDEDILTCLDREGTLAPADIGQRLGLSEGAVTSALSLLVGEGKVRICLVSGVKT